MFDPVTPTSIYVGNDIGVFIAQNVTTGSTQPMWYTYNAGLTDATEVMDLQVAPNGKLRMGAYGKGLWENNMVTINLPVVFESFKVNTTDIGNQLKWVIATQQNVDHYEVEYSTDGTNFRTIGSIPAQTGSASLTYGFLHRITNSVKGYYRIRVVDLDGEIMYSTVEEVKAQSLVVKLSAYPSPTTGLFKIKIPTSMKGSFNLELYDEAGRLVVF